MSNPLENTTFGLIGFAAVIINKVLEKVGPSVESLYHGALGAIGAIAVKLIYELIKNKLNNNKKKDGKVE